ncbi:MAG: histidinol-phosphate aminotransferase family protein [Dehalococcoidia bacterium]|nr:histidinol-phosphate aminotransferase family protein [Dehalococcoidia bacterium]
MAVKANEHLSRVKPVVHGAVSLEELSSLGVSGGKVLDFSVSTNPFGPPPGVLEALKCVNISLYPDRSAAPLRRLIAERHGIPVDNLWVGNGTSELILLLAFAYLTADDISYIVGPTYGEYERASRIAGAEIKSYTASAHDGFIVDIDAVAEQIGALGPRVTFICNPNNPTSQYIDVGQLVSLADRFSDTLFVIDEAYISFVAVGESCIGRGIRDNLLVLHSMTKDYALSGLRLGYAVGSQDVIEGLSKVAPPWSVNAMAQAAGAAALEDTEHMMSSLKGVAEAREYLCSSLSMAGYKVYPSAANFVLIEVGDASKMVPMLMSRGICIRDCSSFGIPQFIRIGVRTLPECRRLVVAMKEVMAGQ